jgi:hypothetical protein
MVASSVLVVVSISTMRNPDMMMDENNLWYRSLTEYEDSLFNTISRRILRRSRLLYYLSTMACIWTGEDMIKTIARINVTIYR